MNLVVQGLLPFSLVVWLNTRTYQQIKHLNSLPLAVMPGPGLTAGLEAVSGKLKEVRVMVRRDRADSECHLPQVRNTQISLAIAGVFLVCHSVRWIPNIWELQQTGTSAVSTEFSVFTELYQPMFGVLRTLRGCSELS